MFAHMEEDSCGRVGEAENEIHYIRTVSADETWNLSESTIRTVGGLRSTVTIVDMSLSEYAWIEDMNVFMTGYACKTVDGESVLVTPVVELKRRLGCDFICCAGKNTQRGIKYKK